MIVSKTPLRVSFFGGGTDLPEYYNFNNGAVLSTSIDVNMFIVLNNSPKKRIKVCYDDIEIVDDVCDIKHDRVRETLLSFNIKNNIEISSFCNIPTKGTGLGSSSTYTVGLCNALSCKINQTISSIDLAEMAYHIERNKCNEKLGKQDQYAAAIGGMNLLIFEKDNVNVLPVYLPNDIKNELNDNLLFFYTGIKRSANNILVKQAELIEKKNNIHTLKQMSELAFTGTELLYKNKLNEFGCLLDQSWSLKKDVVNMITNDSIDQYYEDALKAGALGGKLLGAGGGGYLMFYVPQRTQFKVRQALKSLKEYKFRFSNNGSMVVLNEY